MGVPNAAKARDSHSKRPIQKIKSSEMCGVYLLIAGKFTKFNKLTPIPFQLTKSRAPCLNLEIKEGLRLQRSNDNQLLMAVRKQ